MNYLFSHCTVISKPKYLYLCNYNLVTIDQLIILYSLHLNYPPQSLVPIFHSMSMISFFNTLSMRRLYNSYLSKEFSLPNTVISTFSLRLMGIRLTFIFSVWVRVYTHEYTYIIYRYTHRPYFLWLRSDNHRWFLFYTYCKWSSNKWENMYVCLVQWFTFFVYISRSSIA